MKLKTYLRQAPLQLAMQQYVKYLQRPMESWQYDDWLFAWQEQVACIVRSRGGSKSKDFSDWLVFRVLRTKEKWAWLACKSGQLDQALMYVRQNPFVKVVKRISSGKYDVYLHNGCIIRFGIISTSNLGLRLDGIVYDEFEDLQPAQELDTYPQMPGMLTHSMVHKQLFLGTLWIQTLFNRYADTYPTKIRAWDTIPWLVNAGMIQQEISEGITPEWQIDMMYRCIATVPGGVLFPNIITEYQPFCLPTTGVELYGMDFGSDDSCVAIFVSDNEIWVIAEYEFQLELHPSAYDFLIGKTVEVEGGGYNDSEKYGAKSKLMEVRIQASKQSVTNKWKANRQMLARQFVIHINPKLTPKTYEDLKGATFGPDGLYLKDQKHPCHKLDAFLHAIGAKQRQYFTQQTATNTIVQNERQRERMRTFINRR